MVDGDLDESIKRSASDRLGDLVPQVQARTSPGVFRDMALLGLCLELSFNVLYCRTQANLPTLMHFAESAIWPSSIRTEDPTCANHVDVLTVWSVFPSNVHINILRGLPCRLESLRLKFINEPSIFVDGDLDESIKRSASDRLGDLVPQVRARTSPGVFRDMALLGLCLELSFKKVKFHGAGCPFSTCLSLQGDHHCACAQNWFHFSFFPRSAVQTKKIKALRPKMAKIASRGVLP